MHRAQRPIPLDEPFLQQVGQHAVIIRQPTRLRDPHPDLAELLIRRIGDLNLVADTAQERLIDQIPRSAHVALDYVLAALLIAMPFLAGFSGESTPTAFFIVLGVVHLLLTIGTRFRAPAEAS